MSQVFLRSGLAVLFLGLLAGCSPDYNWRDVTIADGMVKAIFPDRTQTQQRVLDFSGHQIAFSLTAARVKEGVFAVGYAPLPEALKADGVARNEMGKTVIRSFYQNLKVPVPAQLPAFGAPFQIEGQSASGPVTLLARTWLLPHALVEAIVTAPAGSFPRQQANEFLNAVVPGDR